VQRNTRVRTAIVFVAGIPVAACSNKKNEESATGTGAVIGHERNKHKK
jgi:hypothetical protein